MSEDEFLEKNFMACFELAKMHNKTLIMIKLEQEQKLLIPGGKT
jgi:hypothetical protein